MDNIVATESSDERNAVDVLALGLFIVGLCALGLLYGGALRDIWNICWTQDDYSHGILLPFIAGYMIWDRKSIFKRASAESTDLSGMIRVGALLLLVGGVFLYFVGQVSGSLYATWLSFFPVVLGSAFLVFGARLGKLFVFPIGINLMAKPLPDALVLKLFWPLQVFSAKVSTRVLEILGVPVYASGNVIEIPGMRLMVEEACSGMRSVMALLTVSLIVIYFIELSNLKKALLVGLSVLVAVVLNVVRVAATGILAHFYDPDSATGFFHEFSGLVVFGIGLALLYGTASLLGRRARSEG